MLCPGWFWHSRVTRLSQGHCTRLGTVPPTSWGPAVPQGCGELWGRRAGTRGLVLPSWLPPSLDPDKIGTKDGNVC